MHFDAAKPKGSLVAEGTNIADCNGGDLIYRQHERPVDPLAQGMLCSRYDLLKM